MIAMVNSEQTENWVFVVIPTLPVRHLPHTKLYLFLLPLDPLVGWISLNGYHSQGAEQFYLETGAQNVRKLFKAVFDKDRQKLETPNAAEAVEDQKDALDELALDEARIYKQKISKYIRRSLISVEDQRFWFCMHMANKTRGPLMHFYRILCTKRGKTVAKPRMLVVELVGHRIQSIEREFGSLVVSFHTWVRASLDFAATINREVDDHDSNHEPLDLVSQDSNRVGSLLLDLASASLLHNAAAFNRRVVRVFSRRLV